MPIEPNTFRSGPPQLGHSVSASSLNDWTTSRCSPQLLQAYSYVGMSNVLPEALALGCVECQEYRIGGGRTMAGMSPAVVLVPVGYGLGTFPTAVLVGRAIGHDPTAEGSGNPGASNVYRIAGARAGFLVFLGDLVKGAVATAAGYAAGGRGLAVACGLAAVLGHMFPVTRRFRGGRGVATAGGMVLVLWPALLAACVALWAVVAKVTGKASLASLLLVALVPVGVALTGRPGWEIAAVVALAVLVAARHAANVGRLLRGEEARLR